MSSNQIIAVGFVLAGAAVSAAGLALSGLEPALWQAGALAVLAAAVLAVGAWVSTGEF